MTFPNLPVATLRVARITQRDRRRGASRGDTQIYFAPGCRLVTAGDGNMVSADYMGHPAQASLEAMNGKNDEVRIARLVQEERPSTCQHVHQRPSRCLPRRRSRQCSGLTRRQSPGGRRQESSRLSGRSAATAGTGRLRSAPYWRAFRSSVPSEAVAAAWRASVRTAGRSVAPPISGHMS
jgi:hypothetical protein